MTSQTNAYVNVEAIKAEYAPYNNFPEFEFGYEAYLDNHYINPGFTGVKAQAFDRGAEAAMRVQRANQWVERNVDAN